MCIRDSIKPQTPLEGDWSANSGYEAGRYLAEHDRTMTAIYAANDQIDVYKRQVL